jgi:hypothetical protein
MSVTANFVADFSDFQRAVVEAEAKLISFEGNSNKVERALNRVTDSLSGRKLLQDAEIMERAVAEIGGTSKLTENELRKVGAQAEEAISKMKAMGVDVPAGLQKIATEASKVAQPLSAVEQAARAATAALLTMFSLQAMQKAVSDLIAFGGSMTDLSAKTQISTDSLQEFAYAGGQVGVSLDSITAATTQLQNRLAGNDKSAVKALKDLGIEYSAIRAARPEDQFKMVADKLGDVKDQAEFVRMGMDLMGKGFMEVAPLIRADLQSLIEKARDLGVVLDAETIENLDNLGDALDSLSAVGRAVLADFLTPFLPAITAAAEGLMMFGKFVDNAQVAFEQFLSIGARGLQWWVDMRIKVLEATNAFGLNDKEIAKLRESSEWYGAVAADLAVTQDKVAKAAKATSDFVGPMVPVVDEAATAMKKWEEANEELLSVGSSWQAELKTLNGTTAEAIKYYLEAGVSQTTLATAYGVTERQVHAVGEALKAEQEELKKSQDYWKGIRGLVDEAIGTESVKKATDWVAAVRMMGGSVETLSQDQLKKLNATMLEAIDVLSRTGRLTEQQASDFINLATQADAASTKIDKVTQSSEDFAKAAYDDAIAQDKLRDKVKGVGDELGQIPPKAKEATTAMYGLATALANYKSYGDDGWSGWKPVAAMEPIRSLGSTLPSGPPSGYWVRPDGSVIDLAQEWRNGRYANGSTGTSFDNAPWDQRASGGPVSQGSTYLVGERGPELFVPNMSGGILPNGTGLGGTVVQVNVSGLLLSSDPNARQQLARAVDEAITKRMSGRGARL